MTECTPITSQEALERVLKDRLDRERAKFANYSDLAAKAAYAVTLDTGPVVPTTGVTPALHLRSRAA